MLVLKLAEELLGDAFDIEGRLEPPCDIDELTFPSASKSARSNTIWLSLPRKRSPG